MVLHYCLTKIYDKFAIFLQMGYPQLYHSHMQINEQLKSLIGDIRN
jgi:hypothetical protein